MKVQYAPWEKRNLGITSYEIAIEQEDSPEELKRKLLEIEDAEYIVVKTPVNSKAFIWAMPEMGFTFVETQVLLRVDKENYVPRPYPKEYQGRITVRTVKDDMGIRRVMDHIGKEIFTTDRISIDKIFTKTDAAKRYQNWTRDILERGGRIDEMFLDEVPVGFAIIPKNEGKIGFAGLAGLYEGYQGKHLGGAIFRTSIEGVLKGGCDCSCTGTSSNNFISLRAHLKEGYTIDHLEYVYVKHSERK